MPNVSLVQRTVIPDRKYRGHRKDYNDWIKQVPLDNHMALRIEFASKVEAANLCSAFYHRRRRHFPEMAGLKFVKRGNIIFLWREEER